MTEYKVKLGKSKKPCMLLSHLFKAIFETYVFGSIETFISEHKRADESTTRGGQIPAFILKKIKNAEKSYR